MKKHKKRRNRATTKPRQDKELERLIAFHRQRHPEIFPTPKQEKLMEELVEAERAYLHPEEWGIDLRPVFAKLIDPPPSPADLSDAEVSEILDSMIDLFARYHLCIQYTDHLSDREFYAYLMEKVLPEPLGLSGKGIGTLIFLECCPCDIDEWFCYFADDFDRNEFETMTKRKPPAMKPLAANRDERIVKLAEAYRMQPIPTYHEAIAGAGNPAG